MVKKTTKKNATTAKKPTKKEVKHVTPDLLAAVLAGEYGVEGQWNVKLTAAGYSPSAVTKKLNDLKKLATELAPIKDKAGAYWEILLKL